MNATGMFDSSVPSSSASSFWERGSDATHDSHATTHDLHEVNEEVKPAADGETIFKRLVGAWTLESVQGASKNGRISNPLGSHPRGLILYTDEGYVTASIEADDDAPSAAPPTILYTGPFELTHPAAAFMPCDGRNPDAISHDLVQSALDEEELGTILVRELSIDGEGKDSRLTLRTTETWPLGPEVSTTFETVRSGM
jgi:Lipocalin-like domain